MLAAFYCSKKIASKYFYEIGNEWYTKTKKIALAIPNNKSELNRVMDNNQKGDFSYFVHGSFEDTKSEKSYFELNLYLANNAPHAYGTVTLKYGKAKIKDFEKKIMDEEISETTIITNAASPRV
jgi:hypothetical protein